MQSNAQVDADNVKKNIEGLQALAKFSNSAVKEVTRMKNQQIKKEASEIWLRILTILKHLLKRS